MVDYLDRPDIQSGGIDSQVDLALGPAVLGAMLFYLPLSLAINLEASAIDQQVQVGRPVVVLDVDGQGGLPPADSTEAGYWPIQLQQLLHAVGQSARLPQGEHEQHCSNGGVGVNRRVFIGPSAFPLLVHGRLHTVRLP